MPSENTREKLAAAAELRIPRRHPDASLGAHVEQLETYMLESAWHQGELEQERLRTHEALHGLQETWDHLTGWEPFRRSKTETAVEDAKRQLRPDLYDAIKKAKWLIARCTEQIGRLERDAEKCSRAYTLVSGS